MVLNQLFFSFSLGIISSLLLVYSANKYRLLPRIVSKISNIKMQVGTDSSNLSLHEYCRRAYVVADDEFMKLSNMPLGWPSALFTDSLMHRYSCFKDVGALSKLKNYYAQYRSETAVIATPDACMHGNALLFLWRHTQDAHDKRLADRMYEFINGWYDRYGFVPYRSGMKDISLVDAIGEICPFLVNYGVTCDNRKSLDIAIGQISGFIDHAVDRITGLPYHGYVNRENGYYQLGLNGWSRGVGWYLRGLVGILEHLPTGNDALVLKLKTSLQHTVDTLRLLQRTDGSWGVQVTDPSSEHEMSGTAMIGHEILKAIRINMLPESYYAVVEKVIDACRKYTTQNGYLMQASEECRGLGIYGDRFGHYFWGQGALASLLAQFQAHTGDGN